ncbi:MAG: sortase [Anaerolineae bacterium]|nr:sortase [Anaerolineae bacterium]
MRSIQAKIWQFVGLALIGAGLLIMAWGGWTFYQQQAELYNPPARIVEAPVIEEPDTLPVQPSPTEAPALAVAAETNSAGPTAEPEPIPTTLPGQTPENNPTQPPLLEDEVDPRFETPMAAATPPAEIVPTIETQPTTLPVEVALETDVPSLADNPLVVVTEEEPPAQPGAVGPVGETTAALAPPTRIVAESIGLDSPVVETGWTEVIQDGVATNVWTVADYAAGWHKNSMLPGQAGNIVLSGHHNIKGEVFRYIVDLEVGDLVSLYVGEQRYDYMVNDKFILKDKGESESVRRANAKWIGPFNEERLTLVTCWPYSNNTHRVIVVARPVLVQ